SGPHLAYWINAGTFAFSAACVVLIPARLLQSERPVGRGHWRDLREGFQAVLQSRALTTVLVAWTIAMVALGLINLAEIFLAKRTFSSGNFGFGLLMAGSGTGLAAGGLLASRLADRFGVRYVYPRALLLYALGAAAAAASPDVWVGAVAMVLVGFGNGVAVVMNITLVQRGAPDRVRGRALASIMSVNYAMVLVAFLAAGPLTNAAGESITYAVAAAAPVISALHAIRPSQPTEPLCL